MRAQAVRPEYPLVSSAVDMGSIVRSRPVPPLRGRLGTAVRRYALGMRIKKMFYGAVGFLAVKVGSRRARRRFRKALRRA